MRFNKGLWITLALTGCATAPRPEPKGGGPRGLRATEHVGAAHQHDELAKQRSMEPDMRAIAPGGPMHTVAFAWTPASYPAVEHERLAAAHRGKAAELEAEYQQACGTRSIAEVAVSPLARFGIGGWPTSTGVILYLSPDAGSADKLLADLKCHRAWMMLSPTDMDDCPLDLPGIVVDAHGDGNGVSLSIVVRDLKLVEELHRRAALELESH